MRIDRARKLVNSERREMAARLNAGTVPVIGRWRYKRGKTKQQR
jgi:hypothetical protein